MTRIEIPNSSRRGGSPRVVRALVLLLVLAGGAVALWSWLSLTWAYSDGERAGILQRFSRKGWLCKTYEGEIALYYGGGQYLGPGTTAQTWDFSVRDKAVATELDHAVGHRVQLHYTEHPGLLSSCFAETRYFVDRVTVTDDPAFDQPTSTGNPARTHAQELQPGTNLPAPPPPANP